MFPGIRFEEFKLTKEDFDFSILKNKNMGSNKKLKISYSTLLIGATLAVAGLLSMKLLADCQSKVKF